MKEAQKFKCWPADLAVLGLRSDRGGNLSNNKMFFCCTQVFVAHSLSLSPCHRPDLTEILL